MSPIQQSGRERAEIWAPHIVTATAASVVTFAGLIAYKKFVKRIPTSQAVPAAYFSNKSWIKGIVTSVGDADNFRLYHTPGPLILWRLKLRRIPQTTKELQNQTIHIRLSGADAPEAAHFGREKQPYSGEALAWLKSQVEGKRVYCQIVRRDQYSRIVSNVYLPPRLLPGFIFKGKNLSLEMVRAGWGVTYLQAGAEYGSVGKEGFLRAEAIARAARRGMWEKGTNLESPSEYKRRHVVSEASDSTKDLAAPARSVLSRLLYWRK